MCKVCERQNKLVDVLYPFLLPGVELKIVEVDEGSYEQLQIRLGDKAATLTADGDSGPSYFHWEPGAQQPEPKVLELWEFVNELKKAVRPDFRARMKFEGAGDLAGKVSVRLDGVGWVDLDLKPTDQNVAPAMTLLEQAVLAAAPG